MSDILRAEDGAQFNATIQQTEDGPQASYVVTLDAGNTTKMQSDVRLFKSEAEARSWLESEAARHGFAKYSVDFR